MARIDRNIAGLVCMEATGLKSKYLYQEIIDDAFKATGIGFLLLQYAFEQDGEGMTYTRCV